MSKSLNGWRIMWVLVAFDLPTTSKQEIKNYTQFRKLILAENFAPFQFSVYIRHFATMETAQSAIKRIGVYTPKGGKVSFFLITDKQYGMTKNFYGAQTKYSTQMPTKSNQFMLFSDDL